MGRFRRGPAERGGALRRTRVFAGGKNLGAGRIHFARASEILEGSPQSRRLCGAGKKKMRNLGTVQLPTEAFMAVLKLDE